MGTMTAKLLPLFVYPVGLTILAGLASLLLSKLGSVRASRWVLAVGIGLLWVASTPIIANWLYSRLEAEFPPVAVGALPNADVAILLGGVVGQPLPPRVAVDLGDPSDRILQAARLYRAGKVDWILVSGGNQDWQASVKPEAELIADLLVEFGVPATAIVVETKSRNTHENAINSAAIMADHGWHRALLVTSGAHMPRAMATFRRAGVSVIPAATDIRVRYPLVDSVLDFLPDASALERTTEAVKEYLGLLVYRLRGWA